MSFIFVHFFVLISYRDQAIWDPLGPPYGAGPVEKTNEFGFPSISRLCIIWWLRGSRGAQNPRGRPTKVLPARGSVFCPNVASDFGKIMYYV